MKNTFTFAKNPFRIMPKMILKSKKDYYLEMCDRFGLGWVLLYNHPRMMIGDKYIMLFVPKDEPMLVNDSKEANRCLYEYDATTHYLEIFGDYYNDNNGNFRMVLWDDFVDESFYTTQDLSLSLYGVFLQEIKSF